ncbi:ATP-binding cassette domain-containing protein [Corynebacterium felinum]|uniref:ABC-2 type transport system ATP-binding protein n=1 Tax=Corynebacterium felinum TaxID=131318 RepID=A0ABU2BBR0_9CORY|nr:ATP-binding cassette domain-containing protein [Corynebacterium felinum]MDF5821769.1 ATP-binding cassette domain-containing protein [Corynebacterium felinum]MDR7355424.1 ABC-2 type transport system ATP-binding protein [Corynebacterium felinum]WJY94775.1 Doxorubicin resistance ATP-binding protein DrrA [Corynebacterium felinum]
MTTHTTCTPTLQISNLHKSYGDFHVLRGVDLHVAPGTIHGLLGPNGSGKTTLVSIVSTLLSPDSGSVTVCGKDVVHDAGGVRQLISLTGQYASVDTHLTGRENLEFFGRLRGLGKVQARERAQELLEDFSLTEAAARRAGDYSGGMRRRLDIACSLVTEPALIILDEPTTGLDPRSRREVWHLLRGLRDRGITILLTSQYLDEVDVLSDYITVIKKGSVIATGTADELKQRSGPSVCEVRPADPDELVTVVEIVQKAGWQEVSIDEDHSCVVLPAPDPARVLPEVIAAVEAAGVVVTDIGIRRPSLDDVFLALVAENAPEVVNQ